MLVDNFLIPTQIFKIHGFFFPAKLPKLKKFQVAFTPIGYPGLSKGVFHVDMYTSPAWFASIISLLSVIFIFIFLEENYAGLDQGADTEGRLGKIGFLSSLFEN